MDADEDEGSRVSAQALWTVSAVALVLAVLAAFGERRRTLRRNLDSVGWVPWNFIQITAGIVAVVAAALALKSEGL